LAARAGCDTRRVLRPILVLLAVAAVLGGPAAHAAVPPVTAAMTLAGEDFPGGAVLLGEGTAPAPFLPKIAASSRYSRSFGSARLGTVDLPTVNSAALLAKRTTDVTRLMSSLVLVTRSPEGRKAFLDEIRSSMGAAASKVTSANVVRARSLAVGDSAVEVLLRFRTATSTFQVGEVWVSSGRALSVVLYLAAEPGVGAGQSTALARTLAGHLQDALVPAPRNTTRPAVSGLAQVGQTLAATPGAWSSSLPP